MHVDLARLGRDLDVIDHRLEGLAAVLEAGGRPGDAIAVQHRRAELADAIARLAELRRRIAA